MTVRARKLPDRLWRPTPSAAHVGKGWPGWRRCATTIGFDMTGLRSVCELRHRYADGSPSSAVAGNRASTAWVAARRCGGCAAGRLRAPTTSRPCSGRPTPSRRCAGSTGPPVSELQQSLNQGDRRRPGAGRPLRAADRRRRARLPGRPRPRHRRDRRAGDVGRVRPVNGADQCAGQGDRPGQRLPHPRPAARRRPADGPHLLRLRRDGGAGVGGAQDRRPGGAAPARWSCTARRARKAPATWP